MQNCKLALSTFKMQCSAELADNCVLHFAWFADLSKCSVLCLKLHFPHCSHESSRSNLVVQLFASTVLRQLIDSCIEKGASWNREYVTQLEAFQFYFAQPGILPCPPVIVVIVLISSIHLLVNSQPTESWFTTWSPHMWGSIRHMS